MLWLDHLRKDVGAYHDFLAFLAEQRILAERQFRQAKTMDHVNRINGRIDGMDGIEMIATQQDREDANAAERAAQRERASAGISLAH